MNEETLKDMSERTKSLGVPDAAARLYSIMEDIKIEQMECGGL